MKVARRLLVLAGLGAVAGCSALIGADDIKVVDSLDDDGGGPSDAHGNEAASGGDGSGGGDDAGGGGDDGGGGNDVFVPKPPNPACIVGDASRPGFTFAYEPSQPLHAGQVTIYAHDPSTGFTNVGVSVCTPESATPIVDESAATLADAATYTWRFAPITLPAGESQVSFHADPSAKVYATTRVIIFP